MILTKIKKRISLLLFLLSLNSSGLALNHSSLPLDSILKAQSSDEISLSLKKNREKKLLQSLCAKQKEEKKIPLACYKLKEKADFWCLSLKLESPSRIKEIEEALKSSFLSEKCKNFLKSRKELLKYREKDFFLPELKNYFTDQKAFF